MARKHIHTKSTKTVLNVAANGETELGDLVEILMNGSSNPGLAPQSYRNRKALVEEVEIANRSRLLHFELLSGASTHCSSIWYLDQG